MVPDTVLPHIYLIEMRILSIIVIILFCFFTATAQKEDNVWVFGYKYSSQPLANGIYFFLMIRW
jgi:hypothetical protein